VQPYQDQLSRLGTLGLGPNAIPIGRKKPKSLSAWVKSPKSAKFTWFLNDVAQAYGCKIDADTKTTWFTEKTWFTITGDKCQEAMDCIERSLKEYKNRQKTCARERTNL
jgi:hypothetical protein